ncbi:hypothetical protein KKF61_07485 [Patescibacteria group bacterium]|nr:hypothetical protein [Patescibacteria group bacterium]
MKNNLEKPNRKPDFYFPLNHKYVMNGWQEKDYFILILPDKKNEVMYAEKGILKNFNQERRREIIYAVFGSILKRFYKEFNRIESKKVI